MLLGFEFKLDKEDILHQKRYTDHYLLPYLSPQPTLFQKKMDTSNTCHNFGLHYFIVNWKHSYWRKTPPCIIKKYLSLSLFESSKGNYEFFIHVVFSKELHRPLVHPPGAVDVSVLLLKASILNPVLHLRVD